MVYILTQDEKAIFDFDKYGFVSGNDSGEIFIGGGGDVGFLIGKYDSEQRVSEIINEIFINLDMRRYEMPIV